MLGQSLDAMIASHSRYTLRKVRGYYLINGVAGGIFGPYLSLLFIHNGFNSTKIGVILSVATLMGILAQPVWGQIVDRFQMTRSALLLGSLIPALLVAFYNSTWFYMVLLIGVTSSLFSVAQTPIADAYAVRTAREAQTSYSTVRIFGSFGYAVGAYTAGLFLAHISVVFLWLPRAIIGVTTALIALTLPRPTTAIEFKRSALTGMQHFLANRRFLLFLVGGFLLSATLTSYDTYFALAFHDIGGPFDWTGIAFMIASLSNIPSMLIASKLIVQLGREKTLLLAALAFCTRFAVMAWVKIPLVDVFIQVLHGASFGFFYIAAVDYVAYISPSDLQATGQSIFGMVCGGIAVMVGNLFNGILLHTGGPSLMYGVGVLAAGIAACCFFVLIVLNHRKNRETLQELH